MFNLKKYIFIFIVIGVGCGENRGIDEKNLNSDSFIRKSTPAERVFDLEAIEPERLPDYKEGFLINPIEIKISDKYLYVLDSGDFRLKRFTLTGSFVNLILNGRGEGPGEVWNPTDYLIENDTVWVVDPNPRRLSMFSVEGAFLSNLYIGVLATRIVKLNKEFVLMTLMGPRLFLRIDASGDVIDRFGNPLEKRVSNRLALSGTLAPAPNGGFIYVPRYTGRFYYYSPEGMLIKSRDTIDAFSFPPESQETIEGGRMMKAPEGDIVTVNGRVYDGVLYMYTRFGSKQPHGYQTVLDRYDWDSGRYLGSIGIPLPNSKVIVHGDWLYCVSDTTIMRFRIVRRSS